MESRDATNPPTVDASAGGVRISGYAAVAYRSGDRGTEYVLSRSRSGRPLVVERIQADAIARAVRGATDVVALFNHDMNKLLGRLSAGSLVLRADPSGLWYGVDCGPTSVANDVYRWIARREVTGSSFSFTVTRQHLVEEEDVTVRWLDDFTLLDVSPVVLPAYASTSATVRLTPKPTVWEQYGGKPLPWARYQARAHAVDVACRCA